MVKFKKPKYWKVPIYNNNIYFFINWNYEEFAQFFAEKYRHIPDCFGRAGAFVEVEGDLNIWSYEKSNSPDIAHECLHATNFILSKIGQKADFENDEVQTYLFQEIFEEALKIKEK